MSVISVRMTEAERGMLEEAAGGARISLSDFVRRSALEAAELALIAKLAATDTTVPAFGRTWGHAAIGTSTRPRAAAGKASP